MYECGSQAVYLNAHFPEEDLMNAWVDPGRLVRFCFIALASSVRSYEFLALAVAPWLTLA